jgi:hypothetical protein
MCCVYELQTDTVYTIKRERGIIYTSSGQGKTLNEYVSNHSVRPEHHHSSLPVAFPVQSLPAARGSHGVHGTLVGTATIDVLGIQFKTPQEPQNAYSI